MIGLILLYWIGKGFYRLAQQYSRPTYLWTVIGVLSYYGGMLTFGSIAIVLVSEIFSIDIDGISDFEWGLYAIPFGLGSCYGLYKLLEWQWSKSTSNSISGNTDILDDQLLSED